MKINNDKQIKKYFDIAEEVAKNSKDPSTKVGAVIVDKFGKEISKGYNGFVDACKEEFMTYERPMKYNLIVHAEMSAILSAKQDLTGCSIYTLYAPCSNCLKHILQSGISKIFYKNLLVNSKKVLTEEEKEKQKIEREALVRLLQSKPNVIAISSIGKNWIEELLKGENVNRFIENLKQNQK